MRRTAVALAALLALSIGGGASATVPGANGRIVYAVDGDLGLANADGSGRVRIVRSPALDSAPAWSPDGARIVFETQRFPAAGSELFSIGIDGSSERRLTDNASDDLDPAWSPDGTRIAFTSVRDGNKEIYVMNADGSEPTRLTANAAAVPDVSAQMVDENPQWSPDGRQLVFDSTRDGNFEVYVMNADGSDQRRLTDHPRIDANPAFSPDGRLIVFDSDRLVAGERDLFAMNADGTGVVGLTVAGGEEVAPDFGVAVPDPSGCTIAGSVFDDVIVGTDVTEKICGLAGNDTIHGLLGNDYVVGGAGDDRVLGGLGRDQIFGGTGSDTLLGGTDRDFLYGEAGNDVLDGGPGSDRLQGGVARDTHRGGPGNDSFYVRDSHAELIDGGPGRDRAQVDRVDRLRSIETRF
jgi:dipeptidyl aminopeptidase/acylaminoacyl peptidase